MHLVRGAKQSGILPHKIIFDIGLICVKIELEYN